VFLASRAAYTRVYSLYERQWKQLSAKVVHKNPWYTVRHDRVTTPEQTEGEYFVVDTPPCVVIIALDKQRRVTLVRVHRYATDRMSLEVPGGSVDTGENPLQAAKRELWEETGLSAKKWKKLGTIQSANGLLSEVTHIFLATGLTQTGKNKQEADGITEMKILPLSKTSDMILKGAITDSQAISALTLASLNLRKRR